MSGKYLADTLPIQYNYTTAMQRWVLTTLLSISFLALSDQALSALGDLDTSFSGDGRVTWDSGGQEWANAIAVDHSGRIIVGGAAGGDFALVRYAADGSVDSDFGTAGVVVTDHNGGGDAVKALAIQADGKILAAGITGTSNNFDFLIVRYHADGTLDSSFGGNGMTTIDFNGQDDRLKAIVLQPDGKILVAGYTETGTYADVAIARLDSAGKLDQNFGFTNGKATMDFNQTDNHAYVLALQDDGKILVGGESYNLAKSHSDFFLSRLNSDGMLDTSFHYQGTSIATYATGKYFSRVTSIIQQADGSIRVAGCADDDYGEVTFAATGGAVALSNKTVDLLPAYKCFVTAAHHGRIFVAGEYVDGTVDRDFFLAPITANGTLDTGFGDNGYARTKFGPGNDRVNAIGSQADGQILLAGWSWMTGQYEDFAVARYHGFFVMQKPSLKSRHILEDQRDPEFLVPKPASPMVIKGKGSRTLFERKRTGFAVFSPKETDLELSMTAEPDSVAKKKTVTFKMTVLNRGKTTNNVEVTDNLPAGLELKSATPTQGACTGTIIVTCSLGTLGQGKSAYIDIVAEAMAEPGAIMTNMASVTSSQEEWRTHNSMDTDTVTCE